MLSHKNNMKLCDVSPGAPMHNAFKNYWLPVMRSERLEAGGAPVKFKILHEDYVAFRSHDGRAAVFNEKCPHRGCSLALGNNADNALTCIFHGWKFSVDGVCVETPNEAQAGFPKSVPLKAYPVREAGTMVWVYFGDGEPARFPDLIFNQLGDDQVYARAAICDYNWLTGLEAILDPSHVGLLHQNWIKEAPNEGYSVDIDTMSENLAPSIEVEETDYGFRYAAMRALPGGKTYLRVTEYIAPSGCFIANTKDTRKLFIMSVPITSEQSIQWYVWHNPEGPLPEVDRKYAQGATDLDDDNFYQTPKNKPVWGQDREAMTRGESFTGFRDIMFEDLVVGEALGAIPDRTKEFLCPADLAIMKARRFLLKKLTAAQTQGDAPFRKDSDVVYGALQSLAKTVQGEFDWRAVTDAETETRRNHFGVRR